MNKIEFYSNLAKFQGRNGDAFLKHYGIIGQKWGQRRWQNADGTFNEAGKERYFGKSSNNSSEDNKVGGLFTKKKKNEDTTANKNIKKETTVDKLNKLLEKEAKRREKYKYIQEKNENGKYEDEYGEYDDPDFDSENEKIGSQYTKNIKKLIPNYDEIDDPEILDLINMEMFDMRDEYNSGKSIDQISKEHNFDKKNVKEMMEYMDNDGFEDYAESNIDRIDKIIEEYGYDESNMTKDQWNVVNNTLRSEYYKKLDSDEKIGGLFNKTPEEKEFKEAKRLTQQLNFDNGPRILKELQNSEYGKKHIQPIYNEYEKNMNKLSDKADKIIKDNPVDEIEAGIASAIDHNHEAGIPNIGYIINNVRKQHYASAADDFINVDSLPLLKSKEDLYTEAKKYKKEFGENIEKAIKDINPKANTSLSSMAALTNYENDKLEKVNNMNDEDYRRYQLYQTINYGIVPKANKEIIRKNIVEPTKKLYPKVEKIINNTKVGDPSYDWSDIGKALVKLGLDDKGADELTSADWKKVYEICSQ